MTAIPKGAKEKFGTKVASNKDEVSLGEAMTCKTRHKTFTLGNAYEVTRVYLEMTDESELTTKFVSDLNDYIQSLSLLKVEGKNVVDNVKIFYYYKLFREIEDAERFFSNGFKLGNTFSCLPLDAAPFSSTFVVVREII